MKKLTLLSVALAVLALNTATLALAEDGKEVTLSGEAKCGKCALKTSDKCVSVLQVQEDGKTVNYTLADNKVGKDFHKNVCSETQKVTVTGTVKQTDGKNQLIASKIDLAK
jgi:RecG-like helicase